MQTYTQAQLEQKSLKELKQVAETLGAEPSCDARIKSNWITAILNTMPSKVAVERVEGAKNGKRIFKVDNQEIGYYIKTKEGYLAVKYATERNIPQSCQTWEEVSCFFQPAETSSTAEESAPSDTKVETEAKTCADCPLFQSFDDGSGRGLCCGADRVAREHHQQTQDCLHLIEVAAEESTPSYPKVAEEPNQYTLLPAGATEIQTAYHVRHQGLILGMIYNMHHSNTWQCGDGVDYKYPRDASNALWNLSEAPLLKTHPHKYQSPDGTLQITQMGEFGTRKLWINNKDAFYYASYRDAEKSNHPVAVRCDDVKVGDKIYVAGYSRIVSNILKVPHLGVNWTKFICTDGIEIKAPWYCPVQISAFPSHEACLVA